VRGLPSYSDYREEALTFAGEEPGVHLHKESKIDGGMKTETKLRIKS